LIQNDFKRLIIPYLFICSVRIAYAFVEDGICHAHFNSVFRWTVASVWGSGAGDSFVFGYKIPWVGAVWFLLALFWCRLIFNSLYSISEKRNLFIVIVSFAATLIAQFIYFPFSILPGLSAMIFYYLGYLASKYQWIEKIKNRKIYLNKSFGFNLIVIQFILLMIWVFCMFYGKHWMDIASCYYRIYPVDILGAISGTYFVYLFCRYLLKFKYGILKIITDKLIVFGKLSIVVLCFHWLELYTIPWSRWIDGLFNYYEIQLSYTAIIAWMITGKLLWASLAVWLVPKSPFLRRIFSI
jgi:hypothetical protein